MIHRRRGSGYTAYYVFFAFAAVAIVVAALSLASGQVAIGFEVPWKGIVILTIIACVALYNRARTRTAA